MGGYVSHASKHKLHESCSSRYYPSTAHWNHFGNACLQEAWILLCWKQSPESSGWARIGNMSTQQCIWKHVPVPWALWNQEMPASIFKLALEMLPAWFLGDSPWSGTLPAFLHLPLGREKWTAHVLHLRQLIYTQWTSRSDASSCPIYAHRTSSSLVLVTGCKTCTQATARAGWAQPGPPNSRLRGAFSPSYLRSHKHKPHMLRDCAYS